MRTNATPLRTQFVIVDVAAIMANPKPSRRKRGGGSGAMSFLICGVELVDTVGDV